MTLISVILRDLLIIQIVLTLNLDLDLDRVLDLGLDHVPNEIVLATWGLDEKHVCLNLL